MVSNKYAYLYILQIYVYKCILTAMNVLKYRTNLHECFTFEVVYISIKNTFFKRNQRISKTNYENARIKNINVFVNFQL